MRHDTIGRPMEILMVEDSLMFAPIGVGREVLGYVLLARDTSTPLVSVALHDDGRVLHAATSEQPMKHGEQLAPMISTALAAVGAVRQDVTAVAAGVGPGPFTGLRVGLVTARTLGLALGIPVYGACSLDVLAIRAVDLGAGGPRGPFLATIDARRKDNRKRIACERAVVDFDAWLARARHLPA